MNDIETPLKISHAKYSDWAEYSAWAIVVGLLVEIVIPLVFAPPRSWVVTTVPNIIIALGVGFEIHFSRRARRVADDLQNMADKKVADANARAAEANEKAEQERLARVQLESRLAPRNLSSEQQDRLAKRLAQWATLPGTNTRQSVAVFPTTNSFESAALADQIAAALGAAGWDVNRQQVDFGKPIAAKAVYLLTSRNPRGIAVATALFEALTSEQILTLFRDDFRNGCEELGMTAEQIATDPFCSQVSVFVGDHP